MRILQNKLHNRSKSQNLKFPQEYGHNILIKQTDLFEASANRTNTNNFHQLLHIAAQLSGCSIRSVTFTACVLTQQRQFFHQTELVLLPLYQLLQIRDRCLVCQSALVIDHNSDLIENFFNVFQQVGLFLARRYSRSWSCDYVLERFETLIPTDVKKENIVGNRGLA